MTESYSTDLRWLDAAARLALPVLGTTGVSPAVGAIVVDPERQAMVGRASTPPRGGAQAELLALSDAEGLTHGRTLYVTMEPAAHYTTLAPVTRAIADAGIARVVTGLLNPDPEHSGRGLAALSEAGVDTLCLDHAPSRALSEGYVFRLARGRPFVTLKVALSADGMVGYADPGHDPPLGPEALRFIERERAAADAVMAGAARAEIEDNDLLVHLEGLGGR
ncbi:MAG TPA: dihydrofolate reductase family protein, partial [Devosia sp.]|nr:dihydrofolate reductase family protein [Devosia sp.]